MNKSICLKAENEERNKEKSDPACNGAALDVFTTE